MPATHARNIALTPELSNFVDEMVASGRYASASEVMRDGLRTLHDRHALDMIVERISAALDELERGEGITGDPEMVLGEALKSARSRLT
ncbi:MAG: type II toxin-antitoxin system ParD family antitoxin [Gammaproteobacteria bacterium]|nr:type II toxin-antitoxin system ParD family antitoxin [Gammaproteobacteria bacterium]MCY4312839.1 type II toxin-antitoxin system ParD family antitoxin [Gammaproteobacteria bacterium]